jgi:hypothetical protein
MMDYPFDKEEFLNDAAKEHERVNKLKMKAHYKGKRSKASHNTKKFSNKYNLSNDGYGFLDMFFGHMILNDINNMFTDNKEDVYKLAEDALIACYSYLKRELQETA